MNRMTAISNRWVSTAVCLLIVSQWTGSHVHGVDQLLYILILKIFSVVFKIFKPYFSGYLIIIIIIETFQILIRVLSIAKENLNITRKIICIDLELQSYISLSKLTLTVG